MLESFSELIKIFGILFALVHFLIGTVLFRDMYRMNKIVMTKNAGCFNFLSFFYIGMLLLILVIVILI